ncbi:MAG TPA: hypothetical protein VGN72_09735 [Tepidisphaeraceae bacterium]|nr:hypothetical protein [Tepidisphaeraceae bacterium]
MSILKRRGVRGRTVLWMSGALALCAQHSNGQAANAPATHPVQAAPFDPVGKEIGAFAPIGEYLKDFFVLKHGDDFHLFYNVGTAGPTQDWQEAGNEEAFGHATTRDFKTWKIHPRVLQATRGTWAGKVVSAPSIIPVGDRFAMVYSGFDDRALGLQTIGLAYSNDLFNWTQHPGNPIYQGPPWTTWWPGRWADCRDAHVVDVNGTYYMYTMVHEAGTGLGAIAIARSTNLTEWEDLGPAIKLPGPPESPTVFERNGKYFLITGSVASGLFVSDDPGKQNWKRVPFKFPPGGGFWSGMEIFRDGDAYVAAAFEWKANGNYIRFWAIDWSDDGLPVIRY